MPVFKASCTLFMISRQKTITRRVSQILACYLFLFLYFLFMSLSKEDFSWLIGCFYSSPTLEKKNVLRQEVAFLCPETAQTICQSSPKLCARQRVSIASATIMSTQKYYKVKAYKIIKILLSSDTSQCLWQNTLSIPHKAGIVFIRWHLIKWY